jgi:hypothetical protein
MKTLLSAVLFLALSFPALAQDPPAAPTTGEIEVYFSPKGGATEAVVKAIGEAKAEILVQAYSFTSSPIAKALVDAHKAGIRVRVILDKSQRTEKYSSATFLHNEGIDTWIDAEHATEQGRLHAIGILHGVHFPSFSFTFSTASLTSSATFAFAFWTSSFIFPLSTETLISSF